jgi:isoquinoline 1-oxidoreductase beta subunit
MMNHSLSRRQFLKGSLAATGLTIVASVTPFGIRLVNGSGMKEEAIAGFKPCAFFEITPDNVVKIMVPNSEMGQGVRTALPMIIADELEADWNQIKIIQAPAGDAFKNPILGNQLTVASASVRGFYMPMRKAGAAGRAMLLEAASQEWNVPKSECDAVKGSVFHRKSGRHLTYGQLCLKAAKLQVPQEPTLKKESEFIYMGKSMPRVDIPEKVSGKGIFGLDVDLPDLHYAVLARPPAYGAKHLSFDQKAAEAVKGVKMVVPTPRGIAVCAETLDAAFKGRNALKVQWDKGSHPEMDNAFIEKSLLGDLEKPGANAVKRGDVAQALASAASTYEATYFVPFVSHATMEPMNFTAHVQKDRCDVWGPTQGQTLAHMLASQISGIAPENVRVHTTLLGCGLGRRARPDQLVEAVIASKALGKPVKVVYTREEDFQTDFFRAAMSHRIKAGLDDKGRLVAWSHKTACPSLLQYINPKGIKDGLDYYCLWGLADKPGAPTKGHFSYGMDHFSVDMVLSDLPVTVAPWRSVQNGPNAFVTESFMDELAHKAGKDPLDFRLEALRDNFRATRVLRTAAMNAGYGRPMPKGFGRGIAQHACFGTYIAAVADVSVDEKTGKVKVHRIVTAVDCGPVVNPDPIIAQLEGGMTMALSTALKEEARFANGGVKSANFDDYPILKMSETPEMEVHIVKSDEEIGGIGELGVPATAPAVANAVFNAVGARVRTIPLTPERVLAALKSKKA